MPWRPGCTIETLKRRAQTLATVRAFFHDRQVLEVQTATLAEASVTDVEIESLVTVDGRFLQTSPEYQMKRLLVAGSGSIYQICPAYRADERGRHHNPEFTLLEWYRLGMDERQLQVEVKDLVDLVLGAQEYRTVTYAQVTARRKPGELESVAFDAGVRRLGKGRVFITDYPAQAAALARLSKADASLAARFELVVDGIELANGYYELGDAETLERRFLQDNEKRSKRGLRPIAPDYDFLDAMKAGLPDSSGVALGFDRLMMLCLKADHIDQVIPFL